MHAARRLWATLEPLHALVYFTPDVRESGKAIGLRGYWSTYFAYRAAPLGPVGAGAVVATFAGFDPGMVAKALPDAWSRATPATCLDARLTVSTAALRAVGVDEAACARAVALLAPVITAADPTGRALFAANAVLPLPDDPVAAFWQVATTLREHRGDGHVAALVLAGLSGLAAEHLQVAAGTFPEGVMRMARGWSDESWEGMRISLAERGLLANGTLTEVGRELLTEVEAHTDDLAWQALEPLGEDGVAEVVSVLAPSLAAVWKSSVLPEENAVGVPRM